MDECDQESNEKTPDKENVDGDSGQQNGPVDNPSKSPAESEIDQVMARGRRPFDVVLRGGAPWGFALNGGKGTNGPLHISKIVTGGKASESALIEKDYVLRVNDVPCTGVGQALDIVDTAFNTLTITVLRGLWESPIGGAKPQSHLQRAYDLQRKSHAQRHSDDSVVYTKSKSSQLQGVTMRPHKRRGDSFNVGKLNNAQGSDSKGGSSRGPQSLEPPWSSADPRRSYPYDNSNNYSRRYHDSHRLSGPLQQQQRQQKDIQANMNRRRSAGPSPRNPATSASPQQKLQQQHTRTPLLSMKSSPNLADGIELEPRSPREQMSIAKSSPSIPDSVVKDARLQGTEFKYPSSSGMPRSSPDYGMRHGGYSMLPGRTYAADMYTADMNPTLKSRSLPGHNLQRYQADYENLSHLGTAPLRSEKISEIDDIDEVTGHDSAPQSPDAKPYNPLSSAGPPTRDPASLKYIKVNQNHEKYPSWPVTKPNGASEQTQPINSRAQSMTDHTNTSKEFPKKQRLAYTPGLRPLAEKNSPTAERKADDAKARNSSDPGFKTDFVYDCFGRVQRRNCENIENRFEEFYNNSKPGYPPPNLDSDGHNYGDKEYNAPSPPERESKGVDKQELSQILGGIDEQRMHASHRTNYGDNSPRGKISESVQTSSANNQGTRPSNLNIKTNLSSVQQNVDKVESSTSPLEKGSPLAYQRDGRPVSQDNRSRSQQDQYKQSHPLQAWGAPSTSSSNCHSPGSHAIMRGRPSSQKDIQSQSDIQRDRPSSHHEFFTHSNFTKDRSVSQNPQTGSDKNKPYIVKSTPYYNTSTQTEMMPYAVKMSDPTAATARLRNAEIQVGEFATQTSPVTPDDQGKMFEEKSIQARMSKDFQNTELDLNSEKQPRQEKRPTGGNFFQFSPPSPYPGFQSIQAKYATDELPDSTQDKDNSRSHMPSFDNASILRKLSEEFYGNRPGMMPEKRQSSTSSQEASPRFDPAKPGVVQQPGMREAESYSSVVIHHDETGGLFSRDDDGSLSSVTDSRHDASSVFSDGSSNYKNIDMLPRGRRSLDPSYFSQKGRFQQHDSKAGSSHHREMSAPVVGSNLVRASGSMQLSSVHGGGKVHDLSMTSGAGSDISSIPSNPKSSSSDPRSSHSTSFGSNAESPSGPGGQLPSSSSNSSAATVQGKQVSQLAADQSRKPRSGSDSVFAHDDKEPDDMADYEFSRKPSLRKAYGIYDETEGLIFQSKSSKKTKEASSNLKSAEGDGSGGTSSPMSRVGRYSESAGLGQIQEEVDPSNHADDTTVPSAYVSGKSSEGGRKDEKPQKYPWQNEAWLKSRIDIPKGSNLKRTTSEQIPVPKQSTGIKLSSYDTESNVFQRGINPHLDKNTSSVPNYENNKFTSPVHADVPTNHSRTKSEDFTRLNNETDLKKMQQQALLSFYQRKTSSSNAPSGMLQAKDGSSPDSSTYESIGGNRSPAESVADVICKVNENLAKSAQRVDSIRRSNSSSSRNSSDYMDMGRPERMRRETDWSRLRSSGSLRYSPENDRRSNRSSFASENHYEDISMFAPSTPRGSIAEGKDNVFEPGNPDASMDSGVVASPTYQNFPSKRRTPPPPPRSPSPDSEPPALPPRKYRENQQSSSTNSGGSTQPPSKFHDPASRPPISPSEKNRITVIPLSKQQQKEDIQVDNSKRDFKSLMSQWENSSPREDKYAAELRKQAQKFSGKQQQQHHHQQQQQQHVNAMPMSVKHSFTKINYSTTYKREPMQPQEATSPSSLPPNVSTTSPVSPLVSGASIPISSSSSSSSSAAFSPSLANNNAVPRSHMTQPAMNNSASPTITSGVGNISYIAISNNAYGTQATTTSGQVNTTPPQLPERTFLLEDSRARSNSDSKSNLPAAITGGTTNSPTKTPYTVRDRSASDHDILSDRRPKQQHQETHFGASPDAAPVTGTKWRSRHGHKVTPPSSPLKTGQSADDLTEEFPPPPPEMLQDVAEDGENTSRSTDSEGFADESYIGHKNKSSRAIGTYKRSKSAAVLQANNNNYKVVGESENTAFQDPKLAQQSWNSDTAVGLLPSGGEDHSRAHNERIGTIQEYSSEGSAPVRPARPSTAGRHPGSQPATSSTQPVSSGNLTSSVPGAPTSMFTAQPYVSEPPGWATRRESPRPLPPPPPASPPYDPGQSPSRGQGQWSGPGQQVLNSSDTIQSQWSNEDIQKGHNHVYQSQYSPHTKNTTNDSLQNNSWSSHGTPSHNPNTPKTSSPASSQDNNTHSRRSGHQSPSEEAPFALPPRDYQRRESAPVRPVPSNNSPEHKLNIPRDPVSARRRSDSSVNSTPRSDHNNSDLSLQSSSSHSRQPSQEELECDEKAKKLAQELTDKDQKLSEVLKLDANKKRMQYMGGLFKESMEASSPVEKVSSSLESRSSSVKNRSPQHVVEGTVEVSDSSKRSSLPKEYWMSPSKAMMEMELRKNEDATKEMTKDINDSNALMKQKEELMEKLHKKLEVLKEEKDALQQEIADNNKLGTQVCKVVESRCQTQNEKDKFNTFIDDLEKIVRLLLNLSGQLARAENAVQALAPNADARIKKITMDKKERLCEKHEDAQKLKEDIDKRSDQLSGVLRERLEEGEFSDYSHFIKMKSKLTIDMQELDDKITLGGEQIAELKKSIPDQAVS